MTPPGAAFSFARGAPAPLAAPWPEGESGVMPQHLAQVGFENRRRLVKFFRETGQVLQLAHRLLGLPHALRCRIDLAAQEVGILTVDRHLGERLDLSLDAI